MPIVNIFDAFFTIIHFSTFLAERTQYPLPQVDQLMQKSLYIQLLMHMSVQFNQKVTRTIGFTHIITIPINTFTFQTTMHNLHVNLMTWKKLIQKPSGNILTEEFAIPVARMLYVRH
jgi:hypothetical protein